MSFIVVRANSTGVQHNFVAALLNPALPVPHDIKGQPRKRYAVYRNNVTVSLVRALEANFPAVRKLLGEIYFAGIAREFVQIHPPQSPLMFFYGNKFANFIEAQSDLTDYPYLSDVARLEQQWRISYHAEDIPCLRPDEISTQDDEGLANLRLTPHPAFALLSSRFPVHSIFMANRADTGIVVNSSFEPEHVVISRREYVVEMQAVSIGAFVFLQNMAKGETLGIAAEAAFDVDNNLNLANCIGTLLLTGAFQSPSHQG
jgi:Putative DNA-binding domain